MSEPDWGLWEQEIESRHDAGNEYGCVRCQAYHREGDGPIYAEHIMWQSKHGIRRAAR